MILKCRYIILLIALFVVTKTMAQQGNSNELDNNYSKSNSLNKSSSKLIKSIDENKSNTDIAEGYFNLAKELVKSGDLTNAEAYMKKAVQAESGNKKSKRLAEYYRELAKIQESLKKNDIASDNFKNASITSTDETFKEINRNDAERLKNQSPKKELEYLQKNSDLLNNSNNSYEQVQNLNQMATTNIALNQNDKALDNYNKALSLDSLSEQSIQIQSNMADLLAESNNIVKAIDVQKQAVEKSKEIASVETHIQQMQKLSSLYFANNSADEGLKILLDAYNLAISKGNIREATSSLESLANYYEKAKENIQILNLYKGFVSNLETLISKDSSLVDKKLFQVNENRITQLEKEKTLKDELIVRKNRYNYVLIGSVLLLLLLLSLIVKAWYTIRKRNLRIALQSLRREMNPHFIFNSLNSVNQFIASNNELEANKYLTSYSNMMRRMMENSNKDYVNLSVELEQLNKYLELEKLRFADKFEYSIEVDESIDKDSFMVPNMIIQPNLENAIWHGLRYKETKGLLRVKFGKEGNRFVITIDDNGIGLQESRNIKTKNQKMHESRGLKNVQERIHLLNKLYKSDIQFEIKEKTGEESGVVVKIVC